MSQAGTVPRKGQMVAGKRAIGSNRFKRFSFIASYWQIWEIYLNIKEIYQLKVTKENRKSAKLHSSQWLFSWQRFVLHMLRMWHGEYPIYFAIGQFFLCRQTLIKTQWMLQSTPKFKPPRRTSWSYKSCILNIWAIMLGQSMYDF